MKSVAGLPFLLLCGCEALSPNRPIVENRFRTETAAGAVASQLVRVPVTTPESDSEAGGIAITQLSDRGQAALIEQNGGKPPLQIKGPAKDAGPVAIRRSIKRRVIVSVLPTGFLPAGDRVDAIELRLELVPGQRSNWRIGSWTQASNGQTVIDVGKLTGVTTSKIGVSSGLKVADLLPDLKVESERATSDTREFQVRDATSLDAAVDEHGAAWLIENAGWRDNLAHNLSMDVVAVAPDITLEPTPAVSAGPLADDKGAQSPASKVRIRETTVYSPIEGALEPVCGIATLRYRVRHIYNPEGRATFTEADDDVQRLAGTDRAGFLFAPPPLNPTFGLKVGPRSLEYRIGKSMPVVMRFGSLEEATAFRDWLAESNPEDGKLANAVVGMRVGTSFRALTPEEIGALTVAPSNGEAMRAAAAADPSACALAR
jgi:hypothetical protein